MKIEIEVTDEQYAILEGSNTVPTLLVNIAKRLGIRDYTNGLDFITKFVQQIAGGAESKSIVMAQKEAKTVENKISDLQSKLSSLQDANIGIKKIAK
jgi:hypothetical protein